MNAKMKKGNVGMQIFLLIVLLMLSFGLWTPHLQQGCYDKFYNRDNSDIVCSILFGDKFNQYAQMGDVDRVKHIEQELKAKQREEELKIRGVHAPDCRYGWKEIKKIYSLSIISRTEGSISGSASVSGAFILGFGGMTGGGSMQGSITQNMYYYFYTKTSTGGYILDSMDASKVEIFETNDSEPSFAIYQELSNGTHVNIWDKILPEENSCVPEVDCHRSIDGNCIMWDSTPIGQNMGKQRLNVPQGTIRQEYRMN